MPGGRPSDYTPELVTDICERIASGQDLIAICQDIGMPHRSTVYDWIAKRPDFADMYARARERQADKLFAEIVAIADDGSRDKITYIDEDGNVSERVDHDHINRSRLRVDARKWAASKLAPKKYGDRIAAEVTGADGGPIAAVTRIELVAGALGVPGDGRD